MWGWGLGGHDLAKSVVHGALIFAGRQFACRCSTSVVCAQCCLDPDPRWHQGDGSGLAVKGRTGPGRGRNTAVV